MVQADALLAVPKITNRLLILSICASLIGSRPSLPPPEAAFRENDTRSRWPRCATSDGGVPDLWRSPFVSIQRAMTGELTARFSEQSKFDALEPRRTSGTHAAATSAVPKKSILNLGVNFVEPLLRSVGPLSIGRALSFQFCNPIFGGA